MVAPTPLSSWTDLLIFAGTTGLIVALFNQVFEAARNYFKNKNKASYLGLRLAVALDRFILSSLSSHAEMSDDIAQNFAPNHMSLGDLPPLPNEPDAWEVLPRDIAGRIVNFEGNLVRKSQDLAYLSKHMDAHSLANEYIEGTIELSLDAWMLATELREKYGFPAIGKVNALEPNVRTGVFLENEANKIRAKREALNIIENNEC